MFRILRTERLFYAIGLLLALSFVAGQTYFRHQHIQRVSELRSIPPELADNEDILPHEVVLPLGSVDSQFWILHTEAMLRSDSWRVRSTQRDNAPVGREVHWHSGLVWGLAGLAWILHFPLGLTVVDSVQYAAIWAGPLSFAGFLVLLASVAAWRWGGRVGGFLALALATLGPLDGFFRAGEADHHGLVTGCGLAAVLAALAGGAGRVARESKPAQRAHIPGATLARRWMIASALCGAAGLWVSAASMVPILVGIACGALVAAWFSKGEETGDSIAAPDLWRIWGRTGALGSLAFYLLEYAPFNFGWRLEVNHPLYALAWWGAGELLADLSRYLETQKLPRGGRAWSLTGLSCVAVLILPITIKWGGETVFVLPDSFLWRLHQNYIQEFRPLTEGLRVHSPLQLTAQLPIWPLFALPALWFLRSRRKELPGEGATLIFALCAALPLTILSVYQIRWHSMAQTLWLVLPVVVLTVWQRTPSLGKIRIITWLGGLAIFLGLLPYPALSIAQWNQSETRALTLDDKILLATRDLGWKLRLSAGDQPVNILSGPTATTHLAYFGDLSGVGTLYWENLAGLKAAAEIFGAPYSEEAYRLCSERGITHIVVFIWDAFPRPYARLHHGRDVQAKVEDCFAGDLLSERPLPRWLRRMPYSADPAYGMKDHWIQVFEVRPKDGFVVTQ